MEAAVAGLQRSLDMYEWLGAKGEPAAAAAMAAPPKYGPPPASAIPHRPASPSGPRPLGPASQVRGCRPPGRLRQSHLCALRGAA